MNGKAPSSSWNDEWVDAHRDKGFASTHDQRELVPLLFSLSQFLCIQLRNSNWRARATERPHQTLCKKKQETKKKNMPNASNVREAARTRSTSFNLNCRTLKSYEEKKIKSEVHSPPRTRPHSKSSNEPLEIVRVNKRLWCVSSFATVLSSAYIFLQTNLHTNMQRTLYYVLFLCQRI